MHDDDATTGLGETVPTDDGNNDDTVPGTGDETVTPKPVAPMTEDGEAATPDSDDDEDDEDDADDDKESDEDE